MPLSHEHVESKILAKIKIYILTRAELLFNLCYEIPCSQVLTIDTMYLSLIVANIFITFLIMKIKFSPWNFCVGIFVLLLTRTGAGPSANKLQNSFLDNCVKCVFLYVSWLTFFSGTVGKVSS